MIKITEQFGCRATYQSNPEVEECIMPEIMTTKEIAKYLKLHEITICKYAAEGKIPAIRIGRVWRFDKEAIDNWISGGQKKETKKKK
jgi:excisionase family DNA binding protein